MSQQGLRFTLDVDGLVAMSTAVVSFTLSQNLSTPFLLCVDIASGLPDLTATDFLEKNATLTVWQGAVALRYLHGIITGVELRENNDWQMNYQLTVSPPLWRAGLRQNFRIFQQQDIQTISATLLAENDVTDWVPSFYEPHPAREFCVQYGETDLNFLSRLWAEEGIFFFDWFLPTGPDQKLVLCDDVAGVSTLGDMPFNPNTREATTACISAFRYRAQIRPSSVENQDYTFKVPGWPGYFSHHAKNLNGQRTQYEIFDYPGRFKDVQHGQDFARYQAEGHRQDAETAACVSNSPKLWPGKRFTLTGHPSETLNREWQVTGSVLEGRQPQAQHGSSGEGTTLSNHLDVIPADRTWRASPRPKPAVDGPQSAIVTGPAGEEIFCDEHGRVRVRFHWDRYCPGNEDSSCWVRVSQAWAGAGFGNLAIPRVGQEVIVNFLNGDPDQPIIMGRTYHQDNRSPGSLPGTKTQMTIRSKTYKGGGFNELKFDDATGNEQVYIHAQKNMDTEVLNNRTTDVKVDHTETIGNNQSITVGLGQTITVGKENASGHDRTVTVAHDQRNTTGNDRQVTVSHDDTVTVKNDRKTEVMHDRREQVGNDETLVVGNDRKMSVKGKQEQTTTGDHVSLVKGMKSLEVKGDLAQKISGALGIKVQSDIVLESSSRISLKVGGSFVVIHPGGVDIMGPKINLNGGGSAGTPVGVMQPGALEALADDDSDEPSSLRQDETDDGAGRGGNEGGVTGSISPDNPDEKKDTNSQDMITTETMKAVPADRTRRKIGVGEQVNLTCNNEVSDWSLTPDDSGTLLKTGSCTASFTASDKAVIATVTATTSNGKSDVQFAVVEPSLFLMHRITGTPLIHHYGYADCGWLGKPYVEPVDVNFSAIWVRERDSHATGSGCFDFLTGATHGGDEYAANGGTSQWLAIEDRFYSASMGNSGEITDTIFATPGPRAGIKPPFTPGILTMPIEWEWSLDMVKVYSFPLAKQQHEVFADGRCTTTKTEHSETAMYTDPDSGLKFI